MLTYAIIVNKKCINTTVSEPDFAKEQGWILLPDGYGIGDQFDGKNWHKQKPDIDIETLRTTKRSEISTACENIITAGVDVTTSDGVKHFSLSSNDQTELLAQGEQLKSGAQGILYHADGELCRIWPAEEFAAILTLCMQHITYHRTYCNHMFAWIARADVEELENITYGAALPDDLMEHMAEVLHAAGGGN